MPIPAGPTIAAWPVDRSCMSSIPSSSPSRLPVERRRRRLLRRVLSGLSFVVVTAWSLALIAWLTLHWGILPRLDQWRPEIEAQASGALGVPVRIERLSVRSSGWMPTFEVDGLRLLDGQGRDALRLTRVVAALSPQSLLVLEPRFAQLLVEDVSLDIRRSLDGAIHVAGLDLSGDVTAGAADPALLDWLLRQEELVVRRGRVVWTDERRDAPALALSEVDIVLRNGLRRHELRLDGTPPAEWGERFTLRAQMNQRLLDRPSRWQGWSGEVYLGLPTADLSQLRRHLELPFELRRGRGALRAWTRVEQGRPVQTTADLALTEVSLRLAPALPALDLQQLGGRVEWREDARQLSLATEGLGFETDDGVSWAPSTLRLTLERAGADAPWSGGSLRADRLDLGPMARIAARLPLGENLHRALAELKPQGALQALVAQWSGPLEAPTGYDLRTQARGLSLAAGQAGPADAGGYRAPGRPGLSGADLELQANQGGGSARLAMGDGSLVFPGVFDEPRLPMRRVQGRLEWRLGTPAAAGQPRPIEVQVHDLGFANDDAQGTLNARWHTGPGQGFGPGQRFPGVIELNGRIERGRAVRVARYLPTGVAKAARDYVAAAVRDGSVHDAGFEVRGELWHFPFVDGEPGVFRIAGRAENVALAYVPDTPGWTSPWPAMSEVRGDLEFDRAAMRIRGAQAKVAGVVLRNVRGGIEDMVHEGVLRMEGQARGPLTDMLRFVATSPVGGWLDGALAEAVAVGPAELSLALTIPVGAVAKSTVRGALQLTGNDLRLRPGTPLLGGARGRVDFNERGMAVVGGRARVLGGEATFEGQTAADGSLRFTGQGLARAEALFKPGELPALEPLAPWAGRVKGQAPYRVQLAFADGGVDVDLTTSLAGMSVELPAPLAKAGATDWPLRLRLSQRGGAAPATRGSLEIGDIAQGRFETDAAGWRGRFGIGTTLPAAAAPGVQVAVKTAALDADAWLALLPARTGDGAAGEPLQIDIEADAVRFDRRRFSAVSTRVLRQPVPNAANRSRWSAELRADQAEGQIDLLEAADPTGPGQLRARLKRLALPPVDPAAPPPSPTPTPTTSVAALDVQIDDFRWGERALGALELVAVNRADGPRAGRHEWLLQRLKLSAADASLQGQGRWSASTGTTLDFGLELSDGGRFAERMGAGAALRDGRGRIEGRLAWPGTPMAPRLETLSGTMTIALDEGRFMKAEPGAARLLGVLSLQALPRRLLLDFRDLFQEGFRFDKVSGDVAIERGVARTDNLRIVGVQAVVLIDGAADLNQETQDLRMVVVPEINAGAASLAFAAVNPALALGSLVAQWVLREPVMAANTREFRITGGWADPRVERIDKTAPELAQAASAPKGSTKP